MPTGEWPPGMVASAIHSSPLCVFEDDSRFVLDILIDTGAMPNCVSKRVVPDYLWEKAEFPKSFNTAGNFDLPAGQRGVWVVARFPTMTKGVTVDKRIWLYEADLGLRNHWTFVA